FLDRYRLDDTAPLVFFSGSKGFHVGLPTSLWAPHPSSTLHRGCRRLAEALAGLAGAAIDAGVYDKVRAFRAPNSRHPKTGLYKRWLSFEELMGLSLNRILQLAEYPEPFEIPAPTGQSDQAITDWREAHHWVQRRAEARAQRPA